MPAQHLPPTLCCGVPRVAGTASYRSRMAQPLAGSRIRAHLLLAACVSGYFPINVALQVGSSVAEQGCCVAQHVGLPLGSASQACRRHAVYEQTRQPQQQSVKQREVTTTESGTSLLSRSGRPSLKLLRRTSNVRADLPPAPRVSTFRVVGLCPTVICVAAPCLPQAASCRGSSPVLCRLLFFRVALLGWR